MTRSTVAAPQPGGPYAVLLASTLESKSFVESALALLECDFRAAALVALSEWEALGIASGELFKSASTLQRPSWGQWNTLLTSLRHARRAALQAVDAMTRERVLAAASLGAAVELIDERLAEGEAAAIEPLRAFLEVEKCKRPKFGFAFGLPITLRNRIAHATPADPAWWTGAAATLQPLVELHARTAPLSRVTKGAARREPWFEPIDGVAWTFVGIDGDLALYRSDAGEVRTSASAFPKVLQAIQRLLGRTDLQERDFRDLLATLAPEEVRGVLLGDYLVGGFARPNAKGGFATVHVGRQLSTGRKVAIKVLKPGMDVLERARFEREAETLAQFSHPGIVQVFGYDEATTLLPQGVDLSGEEWFREFQDTPRRQFIALEWVDGGTLDDVYDDVKTGRRPRPATRQLATWFLEAAQALDSVHEQGLVHRDVKPANLMLTSDGHVKLMDFGIAWTLDETRTRFTQTGTNMGTAAYMAPEQVQAKAAHDAVGPAADTYGLAATFYELFTGRRLFDHDSDLATATTTKQSLKFPALPSVLVRGLPREMDTILLGGLNPEPAQRYGAANKPRLSTDLRHFLADEAIEYRPPPLWRRAALAYRRNRLVTNLVCASLVLLAFVFTGFYLRSVELPLTTNPPGARVCVDGRWLEALTPTSVSLSCGRHTVILARHDYVEARRTIEVAWGRARGEASEPLAFVPAFEVCTFLSDPPGAGISVTNSSSAAVFTGTTPWTTKLDAGEYRIAFEKEGYRDPEAGKKMSILGSAEPRVETRSLEEHVAVIQFVGSHDVVVAVYAALSPGIVPSGLPLRAVSSAEPLKLVDGNYSLEFRDQGHSRWVHLAVRAPEHRRVFVDVGSFLSWNSPEFGETIEGMDIAPLSKGGPSEIVVAYGYRLARLNSEGNVWEIRNTYVEGILGVQILNSGDAASIVVRGSEELVCFDPNGERLWSNEDAYSAAVVADASLLLGKPALFALRKHKVIVIDAFGRTLWMHSGDGEEREGPAPHMQVVTFGNGQKGVFNDDEQVDTLDATGHVEWKWKPELQESASEASTIVGVARIRSGSARLVASVKDGTIYGLDERGREVWKHLIEDEEHRPPSMVGEPLVADINRDGHDEVLVWAGDQCMAGDFELYCLADTGSELWHCPAGGFMPPQFEAIRFDEHEQSSLVSFDDRVVDIVDAKGEDQWSFFVGGRSSDLQVFVADMNGVGGKEVVIESAKWGKLLCFDGDGRIQWSRLRSEIGVSAQSVSIANGFFGDRGDAIVYRGKRSICVIGGPRLPIWSVSLEEHIAMEKDATVDAWRTTPVVAIKGTQGGPALLAAFTHQVVVGMSGPADGELHGVMALLDSDGVARWLLPVGTQEKAGTPSGMPLVLRTGNGFQVAWKWDSYWPGKNQGFTCVDDSGRVLRHESLKSFIRGGTAEPESRRLRLGEHLILADLIGEEDPQVLAGMDDRLICRRLDGSEIWSIQIVPPAVEPGTHPWSKLAFETSPLGVESWAGGRKRGILAECQCIRPGMMVRSDADSVSWLLADETGRILWRHDHAEKPSGFFGPHTVVSIGHDKDCWLFFRENEDNILHAESIAGTLWSTSLSGGIRPGFLPDEVCVISDKDVHILELATGMERLAIALPWSNSTEMLADLDGNGRPVLFTAGPNGALACIERSGKTRWTYLDEPDSKARHEHPIEPALVDVNEDGTLDVVFSPHPGVIVTLDREGHRLARVLTRAGMVPPMAFLDLDGDHFLDAVFATGDGHVEAYSLGLGHHGVAAKEQERDK